MAGLDENEPISMFEALGSANVIPGDTLWLRAGTYKWDWQCRLLGSAELPITIRPYQGERAIIDGLFEHPAGNYGYIKLIELELTDSDTNRGGWDHAPMDRHTGINVLCNYPVDIINCLIHDVGEAISHWATAAGSLIYGNVGWDYGWCDNRRPYPDGHGHWGYIQNTSVSRKTIRRNIGLAGFGGTLRAYWKDGNGYGMDVQECVFIGKNALIGGADPGDSMTIQDCHHWRSPLNLGYTYNQNGAISCTGNRIYSDIPRAISCQGWLAPTITGNYFYSDGDGIGSDGNIMYWRYPDDRTGEAITCNNNVYRWANQAQYAKPFGIDGVGQYTLAEWQALGYDADSTLATSLPSTNETFVYANEYLDDDAKRMGIFVVWNWQGLDTVNVDLSALNLANGTTYTLHNAQDYFGDTVSFVSDGNPLAVDMRAASHTLTTPIGWSAPLDEKTFPHFGAFVVTR